jgi:hypothetical protein
VVNRSYLVRALVSVASVFLPFAGYGDPGTRGRGNGGAARSAVDSNGDIHVPENYRVEYQYLGSWAVAAEGGTGSKEIHVVFASPGAAERYRARADFPEGTVLVKEVFVAATASMTTGTVSHTETLKGWFVMIRDTTGRHASNKLWGEGWGWSWFDAGNPTKTTSTDYKTDCRACHVPAQATEWIYVEGYPRLESPGAH